MLIKVYEGENPVTERNQFLGKFYLEGIPPAPKGIPKIEITLDIDPYGIICVSAVEKGSHKKS